MSNADSVRTHRELLGGRAGRAAVRAAPRATSRPARASCSTSASTAAYDHLLHHDFVFSRDPHEEFDCIYRKGEPAPDPTCYLAAPARTEPDVAPPGGEALYVLVHTPYLRPHHDWKRMLPDYRRVILDKLKTTGGMPDLEDRIVFEAAPDAAGHPRPLPRAERGDLRAGEPRQVARRVQAGQPLARTCAGLYLAGGAAHPGPGMPMVLMSGWIAADALDQDLRRRAAA